MNCGRLWCEQKTRVVVPWYCRTQYAVVQRFGLANEVVVDGCPTHCALSRASCWIGSSRCNQLRLTNGFERRRCCAMAGVKLSKRINTEAQAIKQIDCLFFFPLVYADLMLHTVFVVSEVPFSSYLWSYLGGPQVHWIPEWYQHLPISLCLSDVNVGEVFLC